MTKMTIFICARDRLDDRRQQLPLIPSPYSWRDRDRTKEQQSDSASAKHYKKADPIVIVPLHHHHALLRYATTLQINETLQVPTTL
jgi:hypothetical protein